MNYIRLKIYTSEFGLEKVAGMLKFKGFEAATDEDRTSVEKMVGKFMNSAINDEPVVYAFAKDDEDGQAKIKELKVTCMMLKSKEMEGLWGWDVTLGRMYAEDEPVGSENWDK